MTIVGILRLWCVFNHQCTTRFLLNCTKVALVWCGRYLFDGFEIIHRDIGSWKSCIVEASASNFITCQSRCMENLNSWRDMEDLDILSWLEGVSDSVLKYAPQSALKLFFKWFLYRVSFPCAFTQHFQNLIPIPAYLASSCLLFAFLELSTCQFRLLSPTPSQNSGHNGNR